MKKYISVSAFFIFIAAGLTLGAFFDLAIDKAIYNTQSFLAVKMEAIGFWPLYLPSALMFASFAKNKKLLLRITGIILSYTIMIILLGIGLNYTAKRSANALIVVIPFVFCCVGLLCVAFIKDDGLLKKLKFIGTFGFIYMLLNNVVINLLKALWQRPRFDDMLLENTLDTFRPWYSLLGPGGSSFPSGHTGAACGVFVLLLVCSLFKYWQNKRGIVLTFCWIYVGFMAAGRIIIGRHFLSDTVAAAAIGFAIYYFLTKTKAYSKALALAAD